MNEDNNKTALTEHRLNQLEKNVSCIKKNTENTNIEIVKIKNSIEKYIEIHEQFHNNVKLQCFANMKNYVDNDFMEKENMSQAILDEIKKDKERELKQSDLIQQRLERKLNIWQKALYIAFAIMGLLTAGFGTLIFRSIF